MKLLLFALTAILLSCADYPELDLDPKQGEPIKDARDGNGYKTVIIGEQVWMAENLRYAGQTDNLGKCYDNNPKNCLELGRLYTWSEAMGIEPKYDDSLYNSVSKKFKGICPDGWHLPSYDEWLDLLDYVGLNDGLKLKSKTGWETLGHISNNGTDEYGFSALPAGWYFNGNFDKIKVCSGWWNSTELTSKTIDSIQLCNDEADSKINFLKASWASIRCIKD